MSKKAKSVANEKNNNLYRNVIGQNYNNTQSDSIFSFSNEEKYSFQKDKNLIDKSYNFQSLSKLKANLDPNIKDDKDMINNIEKFLSNTDKSIKDFNNPNSENYKFDDEVFENSINRIFTNKLKLTSFDYFPIFQAYSSEKGKNICCITYLKIKIQEKEKNTQAKEFDYLAKNLIYISYNEFIFLIEMQKNQNPILTIYKSNFSQNIEKVFTKDNINEKKYNTSFYIGEIESSKNFSYESNINTINKLKNEILELNDGNTSLEQLKEKNENIKKLDGLNKIIEISIEMIDKELDGFYKTNEEYRFKFANNDITIKKDNYIILEVKNHNNLQDIIKNILEKKNILFKLGISLDNIYFIGVLNSYPVIKNKKEKKKNIPDIIKYYISKNIIILYPENLQILGENIYSKQIASSDSLNKFDDIFEEIKNELKILNEKIEQKFEAFKKHEEEREKKSKEELEEIIRRNLQFLRDPDELQKKPEQIKIRDKEELNSKEDFGIKEAENLDKNRIEINEASQKKEEEKKNMMNKQKKNLL